MPDMKKDSRLPACQRGVATVELALLLTPLVLMIFGNVHRWLEKIGLGRLPGDFRFKLFGREFFLPLGSGVLLSLVALALSHFF